jgi:uncharacterized membrane protein
MRFKTWEIVSFIGILVLAVIFVILGYIGIGFLIICAIVINIVVRFSPNRDLKYKQFFDDKRRIDGR